MEYVAYADTKSKELKDRIDAYIDRGGLDAAEPDSDPADAPVPAGESIPSLTELDLDAADVGTVIWSTGFGADFSWIELPVTDGQGMPQHDDGVGTTDGIYFIGFPWLSKRKSGIIYGIEEDAQHIAQVIVQRASAARPVTTT
jgi:putative flavoprotein involved in K+ transport